MTLTSQRSGRRWKVALGLIVGLIAIAVAAFAVDYFAYRGDVPRGTTIGGVEIGGMEPAAAEEKLRAELGGIEHQPVTISAGEKQSQIIPVDSGLGIDWAATVAQAGEESANPVTRLRGLFGTHEVAVVSHADEQVLAAAMERVAEELAVAPADGAVALADGAVKVTDAVTGQQVNPAVLATEVSANWLNPAGVGVEPELIEPAITQSVVDKIAKGPAAKAVSAPVQLHGEKDVTGVIDPGRMGEVVTFPNHPEKGEIGVEVNVEAAQGILEEKLAETETTKRNAQIGRDDSITPHQDGHVIDWEVTLDSFSDRVVGNTAREWEAVYKEEPAEFTTEEAEAATFDEVMGEFTTGGYSPSSGQNIAVIVGDVSGAVVAPGETFSLNSFTGPRGTAQGYVPGGVIQDGRAGTAVGGGISQFATTLYNAYYFAGLEDISHTPHSYYISRYPVGREATVYEGAIDLVFRNQTDIPVRIEASIGGGQLNVKILGKKLYDVESIGGGRWNYTSPPVRNITGGNCIPSGGSQGFTTSDTRVVRDKAGNEVFRESRTTVYNPQPIVRCS